MKIINLWPDSDIRMTDREFHEVRAVMFGNPSPIWNEHFSVQTNRANQSKRVDEYGDNIKSAAGGLGGSFMHVYKSMV
jgi:hypothetical protein